MAVFWIRKRQSPTSPPDKVFYRNFIQRFPDSFEVRKRLNAVS